MDLTLLFSIVAALLVGAIAGGVACYVSTGRTVADLRARLQRSEQARNGALDRSAQARDQIAQLNQAITGLRRAHSMGVAAAAVVPSAQERRAAAEKALAEAHDEDRMVLPRPVFQDTQVMADSRG